MNFIFVFIRRFFQQKTLQPETVRDITVKKICDVISDYSDWYEEKGLFLPEEFKTDPASWTFALQKMKRAFCLLNDELNGEGDLWEAKNGWAKYGEQDTEKIKELNKEIQEGLALFGQYLFQLTDKNI